MYPRVTRSSRIINRRNYVFTRIITINNTTLRSRVNNIRVKTNGILNSSRGLTTTKGSYIASIQMADQMTTTRTTGSNGIIFNRTTNTLRLDNVVRRRLSVTTRGRRFALRMITSIPRGIIKRVNHLTTTIRRPGGIKSSFNIFEHSNDVSITSRHITVKASNRFLVIIRRNMRLSKVINPRNRILLRPNRRHFRAIRPRGTTGP